MTTKHSAAPWHSGGFSGTMGEHIVLDAENRFVASCGGPPENEEVLANVDLISAAPNLLEACKAALGAFEHNDAIDWDDLQRAIKKAEGGL